ncbi:tetratricopeptide repeat protein [Aquibium microcysteis]|uniref:tetratricopeptide repeat protein n=1 Tax=Aquibium microcysteis TaxID=675281 RepID=UPI001EF2894F|nr:tetratricopeptide repeat protein [Aquibium microcysteis]
MHALADRRGAAGQPVRAILARQPERIRTLYALTGGNPRVLALIYQVLERSETDTIFADLEALLDQVTPFYKARVEEYASAQQRAVIDAIALNWDPIGSGALAEATGIEVTTISSHLSRLKRSGFVEEVASSGARSGYQLAERFLNIWYLMRHGTRRTRHRLRWLTLFLARLYSSEELGRMALEADGDGPTRRWHPHFRAAFDEARREVALSGIGRAPGDFDIAAPSGQGGIDAEIVAQFDMAAEHIEAGRFEQAVTVYGDIAVRLGASPEPQLRELVGKALVNKAYCLIAIGRSEEAVAVCDEVVSRFAASPEPGLRKQVAMALVNKGNALDRAEEAITTYGDVVSRFAAYPDLREEVARALVYKGVRLWTLGRSEEAIEVYGDVVARFAASPGSALREQVAIALVNKGITLGELGRSEEAIAAYSEVVARFAESRESALLEQVAMALVNKGVMLGALDQTQETIAVYDEVVARFAESQEPALLNQVAMALVNKGVRFGALGRSEEAIAVYGDVVARFAALPEQTLREPVARALVNMGVRLGALGRSEEAITAFDDVVARFEASPEPALREAVARALVNKGITLGALGRSADEVAAYDEVVARFEASPELALRGLVARAMVNKGCALGELGRSAEEVAVYDDVVARFAESPEPALREAVARALVNKGNLHFDETGDIPEAEAAFRLALALDGGSVPASANLAWLLLAKGEAEAARAVVAGLDGMPETGQQLLSAGIELVSGNLGNAFAGLGKVLDEGLDDGGWSFFDDLMRFLRIAAARGHGEAAIAWFEASGHADRSAPVHAALVAVVRGEAFLNDVNPEMRPAARQLFERLSRPGRATPPPPAPKARRRSSRKGR